MTRPIFSAKRIQFTDEVGLITDRKCLRCFNFVYENASADPWDKYEVWFFLCTHCDERLMGIECESMRVMQARADFIVEMELNRFLHAQATATDRVEKQQEQLKLWE